MDPALMALNRFGLGARPGERRRIGEPRAWLRAQLADPPPRLARPVPAPEEIAATFRLNAMPARLSDTDRQEVRRRMQQLVMMEGRALLATRVASNRPFVERLVAFWSNHLCVSGARPQVALLAGSYERDVIRSHVLGRFEDMLLASARHPAMLLYLDNAQSIGPASPGARAARRGGAQRGLNENYARELLELHTLGVDGGYTQQDVQQLARALTGWSIDGFGPGAAQTARDAPLRFSFRPMLHEPGAKTILGARYEAAGAREGESAIVTFARHPSTARFLATKLVRHFVADDPPPAAVDRVARTFADSGGDLRATAETLIDAPEAWADGARKFRTPQDWLVAVFRAFDAPPAVADNAPPLLRQLRHPLWAPDSPKGFDDSFDVWADPDSLLNRAELARSLTRRMGRRAPDPARLLDVVDTAADDPLAMLLADTGIAADERAALALAGPAFQWR
jgi:uncharacterized protein (DUF1800 family)